VKSIVVASGKGGTGKTTITALFTAIASRRLRVAVVDADVEASNLPLALSAKNVSCTPFPGGRRAEIDENVCVGCGLCAQTCRFDAITEGIYGVFVVDPFACEGCGRCAMVCSRGAVVMKPTTAGKACVGESVIGPIAFGQLGPGEDLSGKLVTEVRNLGHRAAVQHRAEVILIDGPPGIGCPLTAAIAGTHVVIAIAEPTASGAHDLDRLAGVAARLGLPVRVVLNKADLSADGASRIREVCNARNLPVIAEIPFDTVFAHSAMALGAGTSGLVADGSPSLRAATRAWQAVESELGLVT